MGSKCHLLLKVACTSPLADEGVVKLCLAGARSVVDIITVYKI